MAEGGKVYACRFALQALYGHGEASLIEGIRPISPLDVLDLMLLHKRDNAFIIDTWTSEARPSPEVSGAATTVEITSRIRSCGPPPSRSRPTSTAATARSSRCCDADRRGGRARARGFIVFPETFVPYYPYFSFVAAAGRCRAPEHLRLYERRRGGAGPGDAGRLGRSARGPRHRGRARRQRARPRHRSTTRSWSSTPTARLLLKRRKITPTYHERMIWGQGDGAGLQVVDTAVGRVGALACWEHYNPLARYALMAQHEEIHAAQFPGSLVGQIFADQMEVTIRHHALEAGCFVVNATGWLDRRRRSPRSAPDDRLQRGAARRLLHRHRLARGQAPRAAADATAKASSSPTSTWR